jgi:type IV pilus assembly protein PilN
MAGLNLLPWREKAREAKKKEFFNVLAATLMSAVGFVVLGHFYMQSALGYQLERNQMLETEIAALDAQIKQIEELDKTRQALLDRMKVIESLQSTRPAVVHLFDDMVNALPKGMYLVNLQQRGTLVQLEGKAESYARVSSYMNQLDASHWLNSSNLNIISTNAAQDDGLALRDFKLDVTQLLTQTESSKPSETHNKPEGEP